MWNLILYKVWGRSWRIFSHDIQLIVHPLLRRSHYPVNCDVTNIVNWIIVFVKMFSSFGQLLKDHHYFVRLRKLSLWEGASVILAGLSRRVSPHFAASPEDWLWPQSQSVATSVILSFLEWDLFESSMQMLAVSFVKCVKNMYLWIFLRTYRLGSLLSCIIRHNVFVLMLLGNQSSAWSQRIMVKATDLSESRLLTSVLPWFSAR